MKPSLAVRAVAILAMALFLSPGGAAGQEPGRVCFSAGERLVYDIKWTVIPAGRVTLEVLPDEEVNGQPARRFAMTARTNSFVDAFYKVRDRVDAWTDLGLTRTLLYRQDQHEGKTRRKVLVTLDWDRHEATYTQDGKPNRPIQVPDGAFDPLSIFYYFRTLALSEGAELTRPVTDGKKAVLGRAKVRKKEKVKTEMGEMEAWLLEPELKHVGGVFEKDEKAKLQIWFSTDGRAIPVKIKSKVAVGSFTVELVSVETHPQQGKSPCTSIP